MKTLGLIGGTSWYSTLVYYRYLNEIVGQRLGTQVNPPLLLYSLNAALMRRGDWSEINQTFLETASKLQIAGAEGIIICANTPHKVIPFVAPKIHIPFIHIADATGEQAKKMGLKTLGLLGTKYVMEEDFISTPLATKHGLQIHIPPPEDRPKIHKIIAEELTRGIFREQSKRYLLERMAHLRDRGCEAIILGCTEFSLLIKPEDFFLPLLDTTRLHAEMAVDFILNTI